MRYVFQIRPEHVRLKENFAKILSNFDGDFIKASSLTYYKDQAKIIITDVTLKVDISNTPRQILFAW